MTIRQFIVLGNTAYSDLFPNSRAYARNKASAVRELRRRGICRDAARKAVNEACAKPGSLLTVDVGVGYSVCELYALPVGEILVVNKFVK